MKKKTFAIITESVLLLFTGFYCYTDYSIKSLIALLVTSFTLIGTIFFYKPEKGEKKVVIKQKAGKKSKQYASGGDMTINK